MTLPLSKLVNWASNHGHVGEALRLSDLSQKTIYCKVFAIFKTQNVSLSPLLARAIAEMGLEVFELTARTERDIWRAFVSAICEGWALKPNGPSSRLALANEFAHAILRKSIEPVDFHTQEMLKIAFMDGARFGMCDRMTIHNPTRYRQIETNSKQMVSFAKTTAM